MAGFTSQIKARFKVLFPKVNLSAAKLDGIIAKVDAKTEADDEAAIDAALNAINEYTPFEDMAREEDRIRDLEAKLKKPAAKKAEPAGSEDPKTDESEVPAYIKALTDSLKALSESVQSLQVEKTTTSRKEKLAALLKDAPEQYRNDVLADVEEINFRDDDHFNSYVERKVAAAAGIIQEQSNAGLGKDRPAGGLGGGKLGDKDVSPAMKELIAERQSAAAAKTAQTT